MRWLEMLPIWGDHTTQTDTQRYCQAQPQLQPNLAEVSSILDFSTPTTHPSVKVVNMKVVIWCYQPWCLYWAITRVWGVFAISCWDLSVVATIFSFILYTTIFFTILITIFIILMIIFTIFFTIFTMLMIIFKIWTIKILTANKGSHNQN